VTQSRPAMNADGTSPQAAEQTNPAAVARDLSVVGGYGPGELLGVVGGELAARGLEVHDLRLCGMLAAIVVINPHDLGRGTVCVANNGYFVWERVAPLTSRVAASRAVDATVRLLSADLGERSPDEGYRAVL
jgi:hypothetical protein